MNGGDHSRQAISIVESIRQDSRDTIAHRGKGGLALLEDEALVRFPN